MRMPIPKKIANAPSLFFGLEFYYLAFRDLGTCRQIGFSLGPIPWTAINDYAISHNLTDGNKETFIELILELDSRFLEWRERTKPSKA